MNNRGRFFASGSQHFEISGRWGGMRNEIFDLIDLIDLTMETLMDIARTHAELALDDTHLQTVFFTLWELELSLRDVLVTTGLEAGEDVSWIFGLSGYQHQVG